MDAWVTYLELAKAKPLLERERRDACALSKDVRWETDDPLGIGALLVLAHRVAARIGHRGAPERALLGQLLAAAHSSLEMFTHQHSLDAPASARLAFRELGLAIGIHALEGISGDVDAGPSAWQSLAALRPYATLGRRIDDFWSDSRHRESPAWTAHQNINDVMLATSLLPVGYLGGSGPEADSSHPHG